MTTETKDRFWDLIEDVGHCMMVTEDGGMLRGRPMRAVLEREANEIWFYTRLSSGKTEDLAEDGDVCLAFSCPKSGDYVSVSGYAALSIDRDMIKKHWNSFIDAWFPEGPEGADVGMIRVNVKAGEYWDGQSSKLVSAVKMLVASKTDQTPDLGENQKVAFPH